MRNMYHPADFDCAVFARTHTRANTTLADRFHTWGVTESVEFRRYLRTDNRYAAVKREKVVSWCFFSNSREEELRYITTKRGFEMFAVTAPLSLID